MEPEVQQLIDSSQPYLSVEKDGRVKCRLNNHILPATKPALESFLNGKKFKRLRKQAEDEGAFGKYEPFLISSKNVSGKLYCALTCLLVNKSMDSIKKHLKGKSFLKAKEKFEKDEADLMEEPDMEDSEPSSTGKLDEKQEESLSILMNEMDTEQASSAPPDMTDGDEVGAENKPIGKKCKLMEHMQPAAPQAKQANSEAGKQQRNKSRKKSKKQSGDAQELNSNGIKIERQSAKVVSNGQAAENKKRIRASGSRPKRVKREGQ